LIIDFPRPFPISMSTSTTGYPQQMNQWFSPNIIGGTIERVPGGALSRHTTQNVDRVARLEERLGKMRAEVADARAVRETYHTAANFADISCSTKSARAAKTRDQKPPGPRADLTPLDAFFERQPLTTNEEIGSFAEWDEDGNRLKGLQRMPRMPELRHKIKLGRLHQPIRAQEMLSTAELQRQAFEQAALARNAHKISTKRAIFEPVAAKLKMTQTSDVAVNAKLAVALRKLKSRVEICDKEREIVAILSLQPKTTSTELGRWWTQQRS
jgi:hypothetical protein